MEQRRQVQCLIITCIVLNKSTRINVRFCYCLIQSLISTIRGSTKEKEKQKQKQQMFCKSSQARGRAEEEASYHPPCCFSNSYVCFCSIDMLKLSSINVDSFSPNNSKQLTLKINFNFIGKALHICLHHDCAA